MDIRVLVRERIREYYWGHHWNCAVTTLRILAEVFEVPLHRQVLDAALGMHGAGGYRAQCSLVEGALMGAIRESPLPPLAARRVLAG